MESPRELFREPVGLLSWFANLLPEKGTRVVVLTTFDDDEYVFAALRAGAVPGACGQCAQSGDGR